MRGSMPKKLSPKVLSWATDLDQNTIDQAELSSRFPFIQGHIALMPDAHLGYGVAIGSVIPTRGAIIPYAVGVDIGCGMAALQLDITASDLPDTLAPLLSAIEQAIPSRTHGNPTNRAIRYLCDTAKQHAGFFDQRQSKAALSQLGTLGGGNHFVEVCLDGDESVWLVLHSGSRGIGNQLAQKHIAIAKAHFDKYYITLDDPNLAYLVEDTPEFDAYIMDLNWAQRWAKENRSVMLSAALGAFSEFMGNRTLKVLQGVNCHHNYTALEHHNGTNLYITRKGAISARVGEMGIIPGSMGTHSYIVRGLGNKSSYMSAPHGAGRAMSRKAARLAFTVEDFKEKMEGKVWLEGSAKKLLDEHPDSYKDIHKVMRDSADLVEIVHELTQILNYKGT